MVWREHFDQFIVKCDSKMLFDIVSDNFKFNRIILILVYGIKKLLKMI